MSASPIIVEMPETGIFASMSDGAYYAMGDASGPHLVQVVIVGTMHFTPGEYLNALGDLLDSHYVHVSSEFMGVDKLSKEVRKKVLERGFISLIGKKES